MTAPASPTYIRPTNAETGAPTLAVYFTAALFDLLSAYQYDTNKQTDELAADVRDELDRLGIAIRPTIGHGRLRIVQDIEPDENGQNQIPLVYSTVIAYLTDAEPDDSRLVALQAGFYGQRIEAHISFEIPTTESEAALEEADRASAEAVGQYNAKADAERSAAAAKYAKAASNPFDSEVIGDMSDLFD